MDFKTLAENLGLEEDEYVELIELFIETGNIDFQKIQSAMAENDADTVMRSAHTIKGAAGNLGLAELSETARIIEEKADINQLNDLNGAVQTLKTQFEAIETIVQG